MSTTIHQKVLKITAVAVVLRQQNVILPLDAVFVQKEGNDACVEDAVVVHVGAGAAGGDDGLFEEIHAT